MKPPRAARLALIATAWTVAWAGLISIAARAQCFNQFEQPVGCPGEHSKKPTATSSPLAKPSATSAITPTPDCSQLAAFCAVPPPAAVGGAGVSPGTPPTTSPPGQPPGFRTLELVGLGLLGGLLIGLGIPPIVSSLQPWLKLPGAKQGPIKGEGAQTTMQAHKHLAGVKYEDVTISETVKAAATDKPPTDVHFDSVHAKTGADLLHADPGGQGTPSLKDSQFAKASDLGGQAQTTADQAPLKNNIEQARADASKNAINNVK